MLCCIHVSLLLYRQIIFFLFRYIFVHAIWILAVSRIGLLSHKTSQLQFGVLGYSESFVDFLFKSLSGRNSTCETKTFYAQDSLPNTVPASAYVWSNFTDGHGKADLTPKPAR